METNRYFYLKLYKGNALAEYWLSWDNICEHPAAAIYFEKINLKQISDYSPGNEKKYLFKIDRRLEDVLNKGNISEELKDKFRDKGYPLSVDASVTKEEGKERGIITTTTDENGKERLIIEKEKGELKIYKYRPWQSWRQLKDFVENAKPEKRDKIYNLIYLPDPNKICITKAVSDVFEVKPGDDKYKKYADDVKEYGVTAGDDILKVSKQKIVPKPEGGDRWARWEDFPSLVSTAPCGQSLRTGTYREISDKETKQILSKVVSGEKLNIKQLKEKKEILNYLGIYELETLLFLILYHNNCRPSSWRGGTVEKVDIVGHPQTKVEIAGKVFTEDTLKFQVKRKCDKKQFLKTKKDGEGVYYVCIKDGDDGDEPFCLGRDWIWNAVRAKKEIKEWLKGALSRIDGIESL